MLILAIVLLIASEMSEPEKPTTIEKTKSVPMLRFEPAMVPKLTPKTICTTVSRMESMMKTARLARISKPIRLNMTCFVSFLLCGARCFFLRGPTGIQNSADADPPSMKRKF